MVEGILLQKLILAVETCCEDISAAVLGDNGAGEGEVACGTQR